MAIVTIFDSGLFRAFISQIFKQRFVHPLQANPVSALIEMAALQRLPPPPQNSEQAQVKLRRT
jgi:hypothetical protein